MSPSVIDRLTLERHLMALDRAVTQLRQHSGKPVEILDQSLDELWIVERGLLVCAQNALDIATHIASTSGRDVPDYATAIDRLSELGGSRLTRLRSHTLRLSPMPAVSTRSLPFCTKAACCSKPLPASGWR